MTKINLSFSTLVTVSQIFVNICLNIQDLGCYFLSYFFILGPSGSWGQSQFHVLELQALTSPFHISFSSLVIYHHNSLSLQSLTIPLLSSYPFITKLSGPLLSIVLNCASILKNTLSVSTLLFHIQLTYPAVYIVSFFRKPFIWIQ